MKEMVCDELGPIVDNFYASPQFSIQK
jgi:hypothetical protein